MDKMDNKLKNKLQNSYRGSDVIEFDQDGLKKTIVEADDMMRKPSSARITSFNNYLEF
jgi:hypothetical protein